MVNDLNTNEIKNPAGTEVEFTRISTGPREGVWKQTAETPNLPNRLTIKHSESGSGITLRRRSLVRFDKSIASTVDTTKVVTVSAYAVLDTPVGACTATTDYDDPLAYLISFLASLGASTTILYDCTGNGARALMNGEI